MSVFRFKQFDVDQAGCAMKVNTDGVLLAALANAERPKNILDIGTGTGVMAMMLAQRFRSAMIKAVEIDKQAAAAASANFAASVFSSRLQAFHSSFESYFEEAPHCKFDLIISNPPFFINSLKSGDPLKSLARHTDLEFFENLLKVSSIRLAETGEVVLILPANLSDSIQKIAWQAGLFIRKVIKIRSFAESVPHRLILSFGLNPVIQTEDQTGDFVIYAQPKEYSAPYRALLKDFLIIF